MNEVNAFACEHDGDVGIAACCRIGVADAFSLIPCERVLTPMPPLRKRTLRFSVVPARSSAATATDAPALCRQTNIRRPVPVASKVVARRGTKRGDVPATMLPFAGVPLIIGPARSAESLLMAFPFLA